jgi:hypothetical protein
MRAPLQVDGKLIFTQLVKKLPAFYAIQSFINDDNVVWVVMPCNLVGRYRQLTWCHNQEDHNFTALKMSNLK